MRTLLVVRDLKSAEPIGVMQLAALLKRTGHQVRLAGARHQDLDRLVDEFRPRLVGYSACTGLHQELLQVNRALKRRQEFVSVFGGPHPTFFPGMIREEGVDAVCRGEGEGAILDLAEALRRGRPITGIPNLWVKTRAGICRNKLRPLLTDLDALPFPDREVRYQSDPAGRDYPVKSLLAARGCPFRCSYCFNDGYAALYGPAWCRPRVRSVENLLAEIHRLRQTSALQFLQFRESVFPMELPWLSEFAERYRGEIGLPFYCHVRADLLDEQRIALLRRAGCHSVNMGIECGDERYRREVLGRDMSNTCIERACDRLHRAGIRILADNMLGLPGAGPRADRRTLALNQRCRVDHPLAMLYTPYPGTRLGERARRQGLFDGDLDAIAPNYYLRSPLSFASESARRRTENLQKWFGLLVEAPELERLVGPLLSLPPNLVTLSIFRAWTMACYTFRIAPHRLTLGEVVELLCTLFGVFPKENAHVQVDQPGAAPAEGRGGHRPGYDRRPVRGRLRQLGLRVETLAARALARLAALGIPSPAAAGPRPGA
jgi:radical SAM superfamily enzyme YgiQ (UPF0313 family)